MNKLLALFLLIFIRFYSFKPCMGGGFEYFFIFPSLLCLLYCFLTLKRKYSYSYFDYIIIGLIIVTFFSSLSAYMQGQSFISSLIACHWVFSIMIFYYLCKYNFSENRIIKILTYVSVGFVIIYAFQQLTYPHYWFYTRGDTEDEFGYSHSIEVRNGIYRYFMLGDQMVILAFFYYFQMMYKKRTRKYIFLTIFFFFGIFMTGSRQYTLIPLLIIIIYVLLNNRNRLKLIIHGSIALFFVFHLTSDTMNMTKDQITNREDDSRIATIAYILNDLSEKPISLIMGDGIPYKQKSSLQKRYEIMVSASIVPSDVGILGYLYQRGLLYVLCIFSFYWTYYKRYVYKTPLYLNLFFFYLVLNVMVFPIARFDQAYLLGVFLYLSQINAKKNRTLKIINAIVR